MSRTCGSFVPQVLYSYGMKNRNHLFPKNVTGHLYDNRIDCVTLTTKGTWEIIVTGTIPLDQTSGQIVQMSSDLILNSVGNFGPPYFLSDIKDIYLEMIPGVTQYNFKLPRIADPDNDNVQLILD